MTVAVTFAGAGDAFGSGGRYQACVQAHRADLDSRRIVLTHMSADMLSRVAAGQVSFETAHDGLIMRV